MSKTRRSFSASEKLSIINEADQFGVTQTLRKHNLSHSVFSGKTQFTKDYVPVSDHTVKVLQNNGYLFKPTGKAYFIKVFQGKITTVAFPNYLFRSLLVIKE